MFIQYSANVANRIILRLRYREVQKKTVTAGQGHISPNVPAPYNFAELEVSQHGYGPAALVWCNEDRLKC
jgi:hypothetical protein